MAPLHPHPAQPAPAPPAPGGTLLTVSDAARRAGVSRQALTRRVQRGTVDSVRVEVGGQLQVRVPLEALLVLYPDADPAPPAEVAAPPAPKGTPRPGALETVRESTSRALAVLADRHRGEVGELRRELEEARGDLRGERKASRRLWFSTTAGVALAAGLGALAWTQAGQVEAATQRGAGLEERALGAEVEARTAQADLAQLGADLAQLEDRVGQEQAAALTAAQERDTALQRLRELKAARSLVGAQRVFLRGLLGLPGL